MEAGELWGPLDWDGSLALGGPAELSEARGPSLSSLSCVLRRCVVSHVAAASACVLSSSSSLSARGDKGAEHCTVAHDMVRLTQDRCIVLHPAQGNI